MFFNLFTKKIRIVPLVFLLLLFVLVACSKHIPTYSRKPPASSNIFPLYSRYHPPKQQINISTNATLTNTGNQTQSKINQRTQELNATQINATSISNNSTQIITSAEISSNETSSNETTIKEPTLPQKQQTLSIKISEGRTDAPMLPIYFDFNKCNIRPDMVQRMENNAKFLLAHPNIKIQIQGNCDERGSETYNLALGEKRAEAAKKYLVNLGVAPDRIQTISFGKDKPLDPRHCPAAWAKDRRDDFVIIGQ